MIRGINTLDVITDTRASKFLQKEKVPAKRSLEKGFATVVSTAILCFPGISVLQTDDSSSYKFANKNKEYSYHSEGNQAEQVALGKLRSLKAYSANWDGENALAASDQAIHGAEEFLSLIALLQISMPHISLANDGEVAFYWQDHGKQLDLGFDSTGQYSYYGIGKSSEVYRDDDQDPAFISASLKELLEQFRA